MPRRSPRSRKENLVRDGDSKGSPSNNRAPHTGREGRRKGRHRRSARLAWRRPIAFLGGITLIALWPVLVIVIVMGLLFGYVVIDLSQSAPSLNVTPSALAQKEIPREYLTVYEDVANQDEVPWIVLAGLGEELTKQGTTSPYDSIVRKTTYPSVSPPIGGKGNQGVRPDAPRLDGCKATRSSKGAERAGLDRPHRIRPRAGRTTTRQRRRAGLHDRCSKSRSPTTSSFWVQAVSMLPIAHTPQSCAPGHRATPPCRQRSSRSGRANSTGKKIYLEAGPGVTVPAGEASTELVAEALQVSWAYSKWGTTGCPAAGSVFPLPGGLPKTVNRCDAVSNITEAAKLVIAAAETPIDNRTAPEWSVLPGVFIAPKTPIAQQPRAATSGVSPLRPQTACLSAIEQNLALLPEPGPFSPDLVSSVTLTAADSAQARDSTDAARFVGGVGFRPAQHASTLR